VSPDELRRVSVLQSLGDDAIAWLDDALDEVSFAPGDRLIQAGGTDRDCYLIVEGEVDVSVGGNRMGTTGAGCPEGELGLLYRRPRFGDVTALEPVRALVIRPDAFDAAPPEVAADITRVLLDYFEGRFGYRPPPEAS
jgi:CRP-like cAMP-binding protein